MGPWSEAQLEAVLDHLTASDWKLIQEVWDLVDTFWLRSRICSGT
jgi:hypothetical protein